MSAMSRATTLRARLIPARGKTAPSTRPVSFFEFWPGWLFYAPVVLFWILKSIRYGSVTLPALANPRIAAGGICGESKNDIFDLAGPTARAWIADYAGMTTSGHNDGNDLALAQAAMAEAKLSYPVVAKPDMSCNGVGVRVVHDADELKSYLAAFPRATRLQLQSLVTMPGEAGIFYIRHPHEKTGRITSVTLKFPPTVTGDGKRSIRSLIAADSRLAAVSRLLLPKLGAKAERVPALGEAVRLVFVGNHCRGSTFKDGLNIVTPALTAQIDAIVQDVQDLYFSRIDLRYETLEDLQAGKNFKIIEFNGSGSEATNIWDPAMPLLTAYKTQFFHYGQSFKIGATIRAQGRKTIGLLGLFSLWRYQKRLMAAYPAND
ncbi:MAG: D-alanine--D-alanine ligase [Acidocella sp. 20-57-95]|nr:MAG: D-alanine--D-alanine ligase [Acidocella sp. 20-57-95]OYV58242.1 MAG: D-alanine--D-alanine ligase [Acidocella sp. 21-58-7]HQT65226.1 D-alanine--D-alanine ligase [Acidocella sp.]HQU05263.1 D-alanine--D-alanine ligase [Acidocella sp.]